MIYVSCWIHLTPTLYHRKLCGNENFTFFIFSLYYSILYLTRRDNQEGVSRGRGLSPIKQERTTSLSPNKSANNRTKGGSLSRSSSPQRRVLNPTSYDRLVPTTTSVEDDRYDYAGTLRPEKSNPSNQRSTSRGRSVSPSKKSSLKGRIGKNINGTIDKVDKVMEDLNVPQMRYYLKVSCCCFQTFLVNAP